MRRPSARTRSRSTIGVLFGAIALVAILAALRFVARTPATLPAAAAPIAHTDRWVNDFPRFAGNRPLPAHPAVSAQSQQMMDLLYANSRTINGPVMNDEQATYYDAKSGDPLHTITCTERWGPAPAHQCEMEGKAIHIPAGAVPGHNSDRHTSILDPNGCTVYDFWETGDMSAPIVTVAFGAETDRCTGDGFNHFGGAAATAGGASQRLGRSPLAELETGVIHHALEVVPACNNGGPPPMVGQATSGSAQACKGSGPGIPMGAYLWSDIPPDKLPASLDPATRMICTALNRYGGVVSDTNGGWNGLSIGGLWNAASDAKYAAWAQANIGGNETNPAGCFPDGDWSHHIHVLDWTSKR